MAARSTASAGAERRVAHHIVSPQASIDTRVDANSTRRPTWRRPRAFIGVVVSQRSETTTKKRLLPAQTIDWISDDPRNASVGQLSQIISQAAAPAFLLGALAAFIAVLISRLNRVIDRTIVLNAIADDDPIKSRLKADLPRLMRRGP